MVTVIPGNTSNEKIIEIYNDLVVEFNGLKELFNNDSGEKLLEQHIDMKEQMLEINTAIIKISDLASASSNMIPVLVPTINMLIKSFEILTDDAAKSSNEEIKKLFEARKTGEVSKINTIEASKSNTIEASKSNTGEASKKDENFSIMQKVRVCLRKVFNLLSDLCNAIINFLTKTLPNKASEAKSSFAASLGKLGESVKKLGTEAPKKSGPGASV